MKPSEINVTDKAAILENLRLATYSSFLASFVQGLTLLARADDEFRWGLDFEKIIGIWRGGCIIRSEYISELLLSVYQNANQEVVADPLSSEKVAGEFKRSFASLKKVVLNAIEADAYVPSLSATLEYLKYATTKENLPTEFMEAELDFFGSHNFEFKGEESGKPATGEYYR